MPRQDPRSPGQPRGLTARLLHDPTFTTTRVPGSLVILNYDQTPAVCSVDAPTTQFPPLLEGFADSLSFTITNTGGGFIAGRYKEEYVRIDGVWKWKKITALLDVQAGFGQNWNSARQIEVNR